MPSAAAVTKTARVTRLTQVALPGTTFWPKWYYVVTTRLRAGSLSGITTEFM
jgi:hypothetical protein